MAGRINPDVVVINLNSVESSRCETHDNLRRLNFGLCFGDLPVRASQLEFVASRNHDRSHSRRKISETIINLSKSESDKELPNRFGPEPVRREEGRRRYENARRNLQNRWSKSAKQFPLGAAHFLSIG